MTNEVNTILIKAGILSSCIPILLKHKESKKIILKQLPDTHSNAEWIKSTQKNKQRVRNPVWNALGEYWELPYSWFDSMITPMLDEFDEVYLVQSHRRKNICTRTCWYAKSHTCSCQ